MSNEHEIQHQASPREMVDPARNKIREICRSYGLFGNILSYRPSPIEGSHCNKLYLIASRYPEFCSAEPPKDFDPDYYLRRNLRNDTRLVYSDVFVYELGPNANELEAMQDLIEYCQYTEFLVNLYGRYNMEPPEKVRRFEIRQLMENRRMQREHQGDKLWQRSTDALNDFFKNEQKTGFKKNWMDFYRSEKFPDDGNAVERMNAFRKRDDPVINLEQLLSFNSKIQTVEMQEHEYRRFSDFMRSKFPFVPYAVSEKTIIDNGVGPMDPRLEQEFGKRVTGEEYDRTLEKYFATEGWNSVANLRPSYFEYRKVSFAASDEPYIATAFNDARFRYAKCNDLFSIEQRGGDLQLYAIPQESLMNFVSLAKANNLLFHIDNLGHLETPSLKWANVICSSRDRDLVADILNRIQEENAAFSHIVPEEERPRLEELLHHAEYLPRAEQRKLYEKNRNYDHR